MSRAEKRKPYPPSPFHNRAAKGADKMKLEPNTKLREWQVKERWGIDKFKLAEYVWEEGLPAFDKYGRRIPTVEMVVQLNTIELRNEPQKQKEFIADQITYFISDDVLNFEYDHGIKPTPAKESTPAPQTEPQAENYFKQNGNHWEIKFGNEFAAHVDHIDGLLYIAHILERPLINISDQDLYQLAKGVPIKETIGTNEMNERNLSKGFKAQPIGTNKERIICQTKYLKLEGELETANLEKQEEIKEQMEKLMPYLNMKKRNFADPNDKKAQANITKRIDLAYDKLKEENMPKLATYLKDTIKTGYYSRRYIGPATWEIKFSK